MPLGWNLYFIALKLNSNLLRDLIIVKANATAHSLRSVAYII